MKENVLLVVNPAAGKGNAEKDAEVIKENLENAGCNVEIEYTTLENNAENIVLNKVEGKTIIVAVGGDGTLNEVVNGLTKSNTSNSAVRLGFIPYGTTNDFARTLKIPTNKFALSENINNTKSQQCDTGTFNGKCFNYVSAFGSFADTSCTTKREEKNKYGRLAYLHQGGKDFLETAPNYHLKITTDDQVIEDDFEYGSISNSKYLGGFQLFKENEVDVNDGKFEVLLIKKTKNKAAFLGTYAKLIMQIRDENVLYFKTSKLEIETNEKMNWSLDGEQEISTGNIEINNLNKNISVLTI